MLGYNHATMGMATGIATCPTHQSVAYQVAWVGAWTAAALWPDFDQPGSTAGRSFGVLSDTAAGAIGFLAGGHRWGTHDVLLAPLILYWVVLPVALGTLWGRYVIVAVLMALAVHAVVPRSSLSRLAGALLAVGASWWVVTIGYDQALPLRSIITAGMIVHCLGDLVTTEGLPVPVAWIFTRKARVALPLFRVGGLVETRLVGPLLTGALVVVADQRFSLPWLPGHPHLIEQHLPIMLPF